MLLNISRNVCNAVDMQVRILPREGSHHWVQSGEVHAFISLALCQGRRLHLLPIQAHHSLRHARASLQA